MSHTRAIETMPPTLTGRASEQAFAPVAPDDDLDFHALLYPNRSLTRDGFLRLMGLVIVMNLINAFIYFAIGAWPVVFFCVADIVIIWLAFKISYAQGRHHERIMLTDDALWVARILSSGHETRWQLNPAFVRVEIDRPVEHDTQLKLKQHGKTLIIGRFLSPKERGEVADALISALAPRKL